MNKTNIVNPRVIFIYEESDQLNPHVTDIN